MNGGYDRNQDGVVSNSRELSFVDDKPGAKSDLDGLSAFDSNRDGLFSSADADFADFRVWKDANGNGQSDQGELMTLADAGIASITLAGEAVNKRWGGTRIWSSTPATSPGPTDRPQHWAMSHSITRQAKRQVPSDLIRGEAWHATVACVPDSA